MAPDRVVVCSRCDESISEREVLKATILALADSEQLRDVFDNLPWVDAKGNVIRPSLYVEDERPVASLTAIVAAHQALRNSPTLAQLGLPIGDASGLPLWSTTLVAGLMRRLETLGYARYVDGANGWNWPIACPSCQELRLSGHTAPAKPERPVRVRDPIAPRRRFAILQRDAFRCTYCGRTAASGANLHVDHVVPLTAGGSDDDENLVTACDECNLGKGGTELP